MVDLQCFAYKATAFALVLIRESVAKKNIFISTYLVIMQSTGTVRDAA